MSTLIFFISLCYFCKVLLETKYVQFISATYGISSLYMHCKRRDVSVLSFDTKFCKYGADVCFPQKLGYLPGLQMFTNISRRWWRIVLRIAVLYQLHGFTWDEESPVRGFKGTFYHWNKICTNFGNNSYWLWALLQDASWSEEQGESIEHILFKSSSGMLQDPVFRSKQL